MHWYGAKNYVSGIIWAIGMKTGRWIKKNFETDKIHFDDEARCTFEKIKHNLASEEVLLQYPDYNQPFKIYNSKTRISRILSASEENYGVNERELLPIMWECVAIENSLPLFIRNTG